VLHANGRRAVRFGIQGSVPESSDGNAGVALRELQDFADDGIVPGAGREAEFCPLPQDVGQAARAVAAEFNVTRAQA